MLYLLAAVKASDTLAKTSYSCPNTLGFRAIVGGYSNVIPIYSPGRTNVADPSGTHIHYIAKDCCDCYDALWHGYHKITPVMLLTAASDVTR